MGSSPHLPTTVVHVSRDQFDVYIGRDSPHRGKYLEDTGWGNPFFIGRSFPSSISTRNDGTRAEVIAKYRAWILTQPQLLARLPELRGKVLGCWCHPLACHGDVLAELADALP